MNFFSTSQTIYALLFVLIYFVAFWSFYKHSEDLKQTAPGLLAVFSLFLLIYSLNKYLEIGQNISLDSIQNASTTFSGGTKYIVLPPDHQNPYATLFTICFVFLIGVGLWKYVKEALKKIQKPNGESK